MCINCISNSPSFTLRFLLVEISLWNRTTSLSFKMDTHEEKPSHVKMEEGVSYVGGVSKDTVRDNRLMELRQSFHPSYIPSLFISEERGGHGKGPHEVTFNLMNEDHTICNPLREVLNRHPGVLHVGYTIPHPSERKVAFMVRVKEGFTCQEVMRDGFRVLMDIFGTVGKKFSDAVVKYKMEHGLILDDEDLTTFGDTIHS